MSSPVCQSVDHLLKTADVVHDCRRHPDLLQFSAKTLNKNGWQTAVLSSVSPSHRDPNRHKPCCLFHVLLLCASLFISFFFFVFPWGLIYLFWCIRALWVQFFLVVQPLLLAHSGFRFNDDSSTKIWPVSAHPVTYVHLQNVMQICTTALEQVYFSWNTSRGSSVAFAIIDQNAVLSPQPGCQQVIEKKQRQISLWLHCLFHWKEFMLMHYYLPNK